MKVLNFGSLNFDHIYTMHHFVQPKETTSSLDYNKNLGGKGLNQSIALAKAGVEVYHAGKVGLDGQEFIDYLNQYNVNTAYLKKDASEPTGHAIIQVSNSENCIILYGGANQNISDSDIEDVLQHFSKDDVLLIQNEISGLKNLIEKAHLKGMKIAFNTAPMNEKIFTYPLEYINIFIVNEVEGKGLAHCESNNIDEIIKMLAQAYPHQEIILTAGELGAYYIHENEVIHQPSFPVKAIDTTAAGDTFTGFFLASALQNDSIQEAMKIAAKASSITVTKCGAAQSIPSLEEVMHQL